MASAVKAVAAALQTNPALLRSADRSWMVSKQRTRLAYILVRRKGCRVRDVATQLWRDVTTMSVLVSRFADRLRQEPAARETLEQVVRTVQI